MYVVTYILQADHINAVLAQISTWGQIHSRLNSPNN